MAGRGRTKRRRPSRIARRYKRFRRGKAPMPLLPVLGGVIAPMADSFVKAGVIEKLQANQPLDAGIAFLDQISQHYTGYKPFNTFEGPGGTWNGNAMIGTYTSLFAGVAGHFLASKFGVNKAMRKVPFIGKFFAL